MKNRPNKDINIKYIDVIPGIRVLAILLIAWFHIWQQSWLTPYYQMPWGTLDLMFLPRAGYLWVDMFIMLSAFQLFLPYVRSMYTDEKMPSTIEFYKKRALRIMPSYYFSVIVCLIFALALGEYSDRPLLIDLTSHLVFMNTFNPWSYLWTNLNVVLWTVAILMQFYLVFPLLVKSYKKYPVISFAVMVAIGVFFRVLFVNNAQQPSMFINQLPAFFDVIAIGFLAAYLTVYINKNIEYQKYSTGFTIISILSFIWVGHLMRNLAGVIGHDSLQRWQGEYRLLTSIAFFTLLLSTIYASYGYRRIFSNRVMIFLASVSYNYYIWHQYIAVKLKQFKFPPYISEMPNMMAEKPWQYTYTAASFLVPLAVAIFLTWAIDKKIVPAIGKLLSNKHKINNV